jgi:hypothetical protein
MLQAWKPASSVLTLFKFGVAVCYHRPWILQIWQFMELLVKNMTFMVIVTSKIPKARHLEKKKKKIQATIC